ncbi:hypothetical protein SAMN06265360_10639 [Haloechinothrix alba]|uniref:Uncharacterized protein n=1 Tax=Haloechinothrix alba TaxID=664784 RepID=A0A238WCU8_9PSEU|nr:hypothetical protein [Haloechinothrix alba]SNR44308.1 hypothetical protein SAMN06265360_10639 [Haloechinothrix alba]
MSSIFAEPYRADTPYQRGRMRGLQDGWDAANVCDAVHGHRFPKEPPRRGVVGDVQQDEYEGYRLGFVWGAARFRQGQFPDGEPIS